MKKYFYMLVALLLGLLIQGHDQTATAAPTRQDEKIKVAYTVPTLNSAFFTELGEGAQAAADEFGVELTFVGADLDVAEQVKQVEDFIQSGVDVLIIQGADSAGIVAALDAAEAAGIPVVTTGDKPDGGKITTHIGFDNIESGVIGGEFIAEQLGGQGKVVELIGRLGTETGRQKSEGLQQALSNYPDIEIVASQPAEFQREKAVTVMENIIQAQSEINAVYAANDDMALGALQALQAAGRAEGVVIVGNDGIADAIEAVKSGDMAATNATPPYRQGYMGVQVAYRIATGLPVPETIKEKNELITTDNIDQAETIMKGVDPANRYWEAQFEKIKVAYTVPTLNSAFFTELGEGAQAAADEFGVELTFVGADLDVAEQVKQVEDFIQSGVDVLIIQGADSAGIVAALDAAEAAGIPVVTTGDKPDGGKITTHIGFDNIESGVIGGEFIAEQLGGTGKVVELIGRLGTETGRQKSEGLQQALSNYPDIEIVASQPAEFQREKALTVMENIIQAQPEINAVYAANDDMALGAVQALQAAGRAEGVVIVGNDGIADAIEAVKSGEMAATNATPPYRQGYMGVQIAYRIAKGLPVPETIKEKNELITTDNIDQAETIMKGVDPANRYWEEQFPKVKVAYTVPTLNSAFFTELGEGAQAAADEFGVELTFVGADLDVAEQVKQVEDFIQSGVDVLIIQGADSAGIVAALDAAEAAGIPVVTTGDKPDGGKITTHIGFDNIESGVIGGEFIAEQLGGTGKVVELIGRLGTETGRQKSEGLQQALSNYPDIEIVASQPAEFQREKAVTVMENIIQAQSEINAVYAANDDMALGALQALQAAGRAEGVVIVGNDGIADAIEAVKSGDMAATNATPPYRQGYMGVQVAYRIATGLPVPETIKEKNELITTDNIDQAETIMKGVDPANRYWEEQFPK